MSKGRRTEPDLEDIIEGATEDLLYDFNCHRVGIIEAFYPDDQTADVKLVDKSVINTTDGEVLTNYSLLEKCPTKINKGSKGGLTVPITKGDTCLVLFNDRDLDNWLVDGLVQRPNTLRTHDFSDAIALVGIRNQINKITDYNNDATELNYGNNKISLDNEKISLLNSSGGSIVVDDKLELKNTADNLKDVIDELITIITNLKTVDPISGLLPIDGTTASSLSVLSTRVGDLLK
jgi:hypothetical protein